MHFSFFVFSVFFVSFFGGFKYVRITELNTSETLCLVSAEHSMYFTALILLQILCISSLETQSSPAFSRRSDFIPTKIICAEGTALCTSVYQMFVMLSSDVRELTANASKNTFVSGYDIGLNFA